MKQTIHILLLLLFLISCTNSKKDLHKLESGVYYLNNKLSNDTLYFQKNKPKSLIRDWNLKLVWKINKDSIYQRDNHGLYDCYGRDKCRYSIKKDTLIIQYKSKSGIDCKTPTGIEIDKYCIVETSKTYFRIIQPENHRSKIRTDVQLR